MSLDIFFDQFAELADAPNGVKKLRELILQLAVQGKLVPQDPNDEPASVLLEKIRAEKARGNGQTRLLDDEAPKLNDASYELPQNWVVASIGEVTEIVRGITFPAAAKLKSHVPGSVPCLRTSNVQQEIEWDDLIYVSSDFVKRDEQWVQPGDIVISMANSKELVGKVALVRDVTDQVTFGGFLSVIRTFELDVAYLFLLLRSPEMQRLIRQTANQTVNIANISLSGLRPILLPLPPFAEQRRIVAKVDQLMELCDELEARQNERRAMRVKLNASTLDHLLAAPNAEDFASHWQRLHANFDLLYDTPDTIGKLRQAILQLAFRGKLVPQDSNDESASVLLEKIRGEKARIIKEGKIKKEKLLPPISEDEQPFELPSGWEWVRLGMISDIGTGSTPLTANRDYYSNGNIPWITSAATAQNYITVAETYVTQAAASDYRLQIYKPHTLIVALYGQGKTRGQISELLIAATVNQAIAAVSLFEPNDEHRLYVKYYFKKQYDELRSLAAGGAQPNLNVGKIKESLIPLPPLAEQRRIVAKVDQFMALCDELEAKLKDAQSVSERLVEAVVRQV